VTAAEEPEGTKHVELVDMRFGTPSQPGFTTTALVDPHGKVLETSLSLGRDRAFQRPK
jgi:hypothetical protein